MPKTPLEILSDTIEQLTKNIGLIAELEKTVEKIESIATKVEMMQKHETDYRISDLQTKFQCGRKTINSLIESKKIGYYTLASEYRFTQKHVDDYIESTTVHPKNK